MKRLTFIEKGESNHWVVLDGPSEFGGTEAGTKPIGPVLVALGGCTGMNVVSILEKMKVEYTDFKMTIIAEIAEEHPKKFMKIHIKYLVHGDVP